MTPPDQDIDKPPLSHEELKVLHHWLRDLNGNFYPRIDFHAVFPIESCNLLQSQSHHLKEWCQGYLDGIQPTFDDWKPLPDFHDLMYHLSILREDEPTAHSFGFLNTIDINQNQINKLVNDNDMIEPLPVLLEIIFEQSSEIADQPQPIEKNNKANINSLSKHEKAKQLCPCLSGKPFTQCCTLGRGILH